MKRIFDQGCRIRTGMIAARRLCTSLLLLWLAATGIGCDARAEAPKPPPPEVDVVEVQQADVPVYGRWVGTVVGYVNANIRAQVTGYLLSQDYQEGALVKKGQPLFEIDPRPFKAALDQAKGKLGQANAQLGKTKLDVERYTPLAAKGAVSKEDLDNAVQANLSAKADVEAAQAAVEQAQVNLDFCNVASPIDGIAGLVNAQVGDLVGPAGPLLTVVSTLDPIKVIFPVPEQQYIWFHTVHAGVKELAEARAALKLHLILADGSEYQYTGKWGATQREVGVETGSIEVQGIFPNPGDFLRPGQFARVEAEMNVLKGALLVPQRAIVQVQGADQVDVVDSDKKVHVTPVVLGEQFGLNRVVQKGIKLGDRVVVEGLQKVRDGTVVVPHGVAPFHPSTKPAIAGQ